MCGARYAGEVMLILDQLKLEYSTGQFWDPNAKPVSEQVLFLDLDLF